MRSPVSEPRLRERSGRDLANSLLLCSVGIMTFVQGILRYKTVIATGFGGFAIHVMAVVIGSSLIATSEAKAQSKPRPDSYFERGKALVSHNCGKCHAVDKEGESPHPNAPPFRNLLQRYPIDALEESYIDEIYSDHPDMPVFKVSPEQLETILDYIAAIQND